MEKTISASEANRQFSRLLREVRRGASYTITSHGEAVAHVTPARIANSDARQAAWDKLLERLRSQPARNLGPWSRDEAYE